MTFNWTRFWLILMICAVANGAVLLVEHILPPQPIFSCATAPSAIAMPLTPRRGVKC